MVDPGYDEPEPEQLSGGDGPRLNWAAAAVVVVLIGAAILLARAGHHDTHDTAAHHTHTTPPPAPAVAADLSAHVGSVFLGHLLHCTRTDHRHHLSVALGVTNLSARALQLVGASGVSSDGLLVRPVGVARIGTQPCAGPRQVVPFRLKPGGAAVVTLTFRVGAACPVHAWVSARLAFDAGSAGVVHADSSQLADLDQLKFAQCA